MRATHATTWISAGLLAVTVTAAFALPGRATAGSLQACKYLNPASLLAVEADTLPTVTDAGLVLSGGDIPTIVAADVAANPVSSLVLDANASWAGETLWMGVTSRATGITGHKWWVVLFDEGVLIYGGVTAAGAATKLVRGLDLVGERHIRLSVTQGRSESTVNVSVDGAALPPLAVPGGLGGHSYVTLQYNDGPGGERTALLRNIALYVDRPVPAHC